MKFALMVSSVILAQSDGQAVSNYSQVFNEVEACRSAIVLMTGMYPTVDRGYPKLVVVHKLRYGSGETVYACAPLGEEPGAPSKVAQK